MKLVIAAVGRLKAGPDVELYDRYASRIAAAGRAVGIGPLDLVELPESRAASAMARMDDEAARLLVRVADSTSRVVLDEGGRHLTSRAFSDWLRGARDGGERRVSFLIGGADGHGPAVRQGAALVLSLSHMTLPHGLARVVLAEQIYRAVTLLSGHPYHRD